MKSKLKELILKLSEYEELKNLTFSLTINLKDIIREYKSKDLFIDNISRLLEEVEKVDKIKSFNLTLYDREEEIVNYDDLDIDRYDNYWYESKLIFYGQKKVKSQFYFLSSGLSINNLRKDNKTIEELIEINEFYKKTSKKIKELLS